MPPTTKEAQRAELHKTIWRIANDLRGSVDGWDFKTYVLGILFYRFISANLTAYLNAHERADVGDGYGDHQGAGAGVAVLARRGARREEGRVLAKLGQFFERFFGLGTS